MTYLPHEMKWFCAYCGSEKDSHRVRCECGFTCTTNTPGGILRS